MTTTETTQQAPAAGPPPARRRLERSRGDRVVAGVCGGIARHFDIDATLVRVGAIVSIAFGGFGFLAYFVAWLLVPDEGAAQPIISGGADRRRGVALTAAAALGVLVLCAFAALGDGGWWWFGAGWPLVLLLSGGAFVWFLHERDKPDVVMGGPGVTGATATAPPAPASTAAPAAWAPASEPSVAADASEDPTVATDPAEAPTAVDPARATDPAEEPTVVDPAEAATETDATRPFSAGPPPPSEPPTATYPLGGPGGQEPQPPKRRGSWLVTLFATGGVFLALAGAGALDASGAIDLGWGAYAALAVILTGAALVASAFFGGARGLIAVGIVLTLVLGTTAAAGVSLDGGIGEEDHRIVSAAQLEDRYELAIGRMGLDLRGLELPPGETRIEADVDAGQLQVFAPGAVMRGGGIEVRGDGTLESGGLDVDREITIEAGRGTLVIDAHVGAGVIVVEERPDGDGWSSTGAPLRATPIAAPGAAAAPRCAPVGFAPAAACATGGHDDAA